MAESLILNEDLFRERLAVLHRAAVGVILVRTKEPYRAIEALKAFAFGEDDMGFKVWTWLHGWASYERNQPDVPSLEGMTDPNAAIRAINGLGDSGQAFDSGVYVMTYLHPVISKSLPMMQAIQDYARLFASTYKRRLVLVTPPSFTLPEELEDDVTILEFDTPSQDELLQAYQDIVEPLPAERRPRFSAADVGRIVSAGAGMTANEFATAVSRAFIELRRQRPLRLPDFLAKITAVKTEVVKRTDILEVMPVEDMASVGGLDVLKTWIGKRARCFSQEARDFGVDTPEGILLVGPPGCGKSACAKAIASVLGTGLIRFDMGRVFQSLVGQSEARMRSALKLLEAMAPVTVLFDECDKMFDQNSAGGDSGVGKRVLGSLLTWLQEKDAPVFVVMTANRTQGLPSELLRKGRLDEVWAISTPSADERRAILQIHLRKRKQDPDRVVDLQVAIDRAEGFVGAELEAAVKEALVEAYTSDAPLTGQLIADQLGNMVPLSVAFKTQFDEMAMWAKANARAASVEQASAAIRPRSRERFSAKPRNLTEGLAN